MIPVSYLFEGKITEHLKKHKGKYALGTAAGALYFSDDITPRPLKNIIRSKVTGRDTIKSSDELLKGYENHPKYKALKDIADKADPEDLNRLTKFGIHQRHNMPPPEGATNIPAGADIGGYNMHKVPFQNFRDREIRIRDDVPSMPVEKAFKHELGHHIDSEKNAYSKVMDDIDPRTGQQKEYWGQKREYIARKFAKEHEKSGMNYKDFIKKTRKEADNLSDEDRAKYDRR
jgi:hypothetical protein